MMKVLICFSFFVSLFINSTSASERQSKRGFVIAGNYLLEFDRIITHNAVETRLSLPKNQTFITDTSFWPTLKLPIPSNSEDTLLDHSVRVQQHNLLMSYRYNMGQLEYIYLDSFTLEPVIVVTYTLPFNSKLKDWMGPEPLHDADWEYEFDPLEKEFLLFNDKVVSPNPDDLISNKTVCNGYFYEQGALNKKSLTLPVKFEYPDLSLTTKMHLATMILNFKHSSDSVFYFIPLAILSTLRIFKTLKSKTYALEL